MRVACLITPTPNHQHDCLRSTKMPKRARSASTASSPDVSAHDVLLPTKRRAYSTSLRSPPLPAVAEPQDCALPLTLDNLAQHTLRCETQPVQSPHSLPSPMSSRSDSPTRSAYDSRATLRRGRRCARAAHLAPGTPRHGSLARARWPSVARCEAHRSAAPDGLARKREHRHLQAGAAAAVRWRGCQCS